MKMKTLPILSTTAKTALAIWLAQSPPEPIASPVSLAICARLATSVRRKRAAYRPAQRERLAA